MQLLLRLGSGFIFLVAAATNRDMSVAFVLLLLLLYLLLFRLKASDAVKRASRLLAWIIVPIIVTHALFTPGEMIFSGYPIPVSVEGVKSGIWYSLKLVLLFFAAMLLSRLLGKQEWYQVLTSMPWCGEKFAVYILLLEHSKKEIGFVTGEAMSKWKGEGGGISRLVAVLAALPAKVLDGSSAGAESVWRHWDEKMDKLNRLREGWQGSMADRNAVVTVAAIMLMLIFAGGVF